MTARGVVLVAVLVVTALVVVVALGLMFMMRAEVSASAANTRGEQAYEAAASGLARATTILKASAGDPKIWYDYPEVFLNQFVADDGANRWYFTVYADPADPQQRTPRYGLTDEAGKINLNVVTAETLLGLPNMSNELVDCLIDYRDADSDTRPEGAEQDYYDHLETPYVIANAPLSSLEELFFVKGFTARIVYGEDANMNGILDPNEDDGDETFPPDNRDGVLDKGLRAVATVYSSERDVDNNRRPRVNINGDPDAAKRAGLPERVTQFIKMYREDGGTFQHASDLLEMRHQLKSNPKNQPGLKAGSWIEPQVGAAELPIIMDRLTTRAESKRPVQGLVNVNTAPAEVLAALPGMDPNLAQQIVDARRDLDPDAKSTVAWLYTQNLLDAAAFKTVAPSITARSFQYSVRCVGFGVPCGRYRVVEAVVDFSGSAPRVVYLRDVSRLGPPFALDAESIERGQ